MTMKQYLLLTTQYGGYTTYGIGYVEYDGDRPILIETYPDLCHTASPVSSTGGNHRKAMLHNGLKTFGI